MWVLGVDLSQAYEPTSLQYTVSRQQKLEKSCLNRGWEVRTDFSALSPECHRHILAHHIYTHTVHTHNRHTHTLLHHLFFSLILNFLCKVFSLPNPKMLGQKAHKPMTAVTRKWYNWKVGKSCGASSKPEGQGPRDRSSPCDCS